MKSKKPACAGFSVILQQDYRVSVSIADCMAVETVSAGLAAWLGRHGFLRTMTQAGLKKMSKAL